MRDAIRTLNRGAAAVIQADSLHDAYGFATAERSNAPHSHDTDAGACGGEAGGGLRGKNSREARQDCCRDCRRQDEVSRTTACWISLALHEFELAKRVVHSLWVCAAA